jgi:phosphotransferase system enzyme I (PtsI)
MSQDEFAPRVMGSTVLTHEGGLHARPSILLSQVATRFSAKVWIGLAADGPWIDAKSIARVMALKTVGQTTMFFTAEGADAGDAVSALVRLVESDFRNSNGQLKSTTSTNATAYLRGISASPGLARGPLLCLDEVAQSSPPAAISAPSDRTRLRQAIDSACAALTALERRTDNPDAQALLSFQVAMLQDPVLTEPAFAAIAAQVPAEQAWWDAMELQIRQYDSAGDLYFCARASDLRDMRDRVSRLLSGTASIPIPSGSIVVTADLAPSKFLETRWEGGGIALTEGSASSHVAMLARARGVPMLIGLERGDLLGQGEALLDADNGMLIALPGAETVAGFAARQQALRSARMDAEARLEFPAVTASGERVQVLINVADGAELASLNPEWCDGIGLVRTELLFRSKDDLTDEAKQYAEYCRITRWAQGRPVTVRLLDAGADKPIAGYTADAESNPFLGVRGVRLSLLHRPVLSTQLRALARAAALGPLQIMVPMVTWPRELDQVRQALNTTVESLRKEGLDCGRPALGIMIEVPAAALTCDLFSADFFSIGSNDLIQYVTACSRDSRRLSALQDPLQPAVLRIMRAVVKHADAHDIPISLCGDMASDPRCVPALLGMGLRRLSVAPAALADVKTAIARFRSEASEEEHSE